MISPKKAMQIAVFLILSGIVNAGELTLPSAIRFAIQDNPSLAQILARAKAMTAIPSQVGSLPDPTISFNALNLPVDSFDTQQENMTQFKVGISQTIPFPGKLVLRQEVALLQADAAMKNVIEAQGWLQKNVKDTWWQIFYLDRALQIVDNNQILLRQFIQIARTKYEVGQGLQQDVLLAQLKAETELYQQAENFRALLSASRTSINAAQSRLELTKKDYLPDVNIGAAYSARDDMPSGAERADFLSLQISMSVPIFFSNKQDKAVDQRTSELMQKKYAFQDEFNEVRSQITQSYSNYQRAKDQFILFKTGIIPQARQTVSSMLAGYQVSKVDFLNLVRSQITLLNFEMQYWNVFAEANQSLAQLTATVGKDEIYE